MEFTVEFYETEAGHSPQLLEELAHRAVSGFRFVELYCELHGIATSKLMFYRPGGGCNPVGVEDRFAGVTQGSSCLATLGWRIQSLRDWRGEHAHSCRRLGSLSSNPIGFDGFGNRSEEHTSELQSLRHLVCR